MCVSILIGKNSYFFKPMSKLVCLHSYQIESKTNVANRNVKKENKIWVNADFQTVYESGTAIRTKSFNGF